MYWNLATVYVLWQIRAICGHPRTSVDFFLLLQRTGRTLRNPDDPPGRAYSYESGNGKDEG
jgi:hypothetical protein